LIALLEEFSEIFPHVILVPDLFGIATLSVAPRDLGGVLGLEVRHNLLIPFNRWLKRGFDVVLGTIAGLAALPIVAAAVAWIKCVSPGADAIFWQEREGENGSIIRIPKLRTMYPDAETMLRQYLEANEEAKTEWDRCCKLKNDPRILPGIGKLLRRTSLDELPQLWSIAKGEMSLVGPRPFPAYHNRKFEPEVRAFRTKVTPGLTGLWQISGRSDGDIAVQAKLDTYYIRNWSPWLDVYILGRTLRAVLTGKGAY
jgi:lipopolysaccharide/colanic/teichoic acid biosynthesis glycosyltransferase